MSAVITRGKITRADLALWDGKTATATRVDATGGTVTGLAICNDVDVLQVYGGGTSRTRATIADAIQAIGSTACTLVFAPGTWDIDDDLTIPGNFTCYVPNGAIFDVASGKTLTFSRQVLLHYPLAWTSGAGTVTVPRGIAGAWYPLSVAERAASLTYAEVTQPQHDYGNVLRYGAVADDTTTSGTAAGGATDNATAFNNAWKAIKATGGVLTVPQGNYYLNAQWLCDADGTLPYQYEIRGYGATIRAGGSVTGFVLKLSGGYNYHGIKATGLAFNNRANATAAGAVQMVGASKAHLRDVLVEMHGNAATWAAFEVGPTTAGDNTTNSFWVTIEDCATRKRAGTDGGSGVYSPVGVRLKGAANACRILNCALSSVTDGIRIETDGTGTALANDVVSRDNKFEGSTNAITISGTGATTMPTGLRILENRVETVTTFLNISGSLLTDALYPPVLRNNYLTAGAVTNYVVNANSQYLRIDEPQWNGVPPADNMVGGPSGYRIFCDGDGKNLRVSNFSDSANYSGGHLMIGAYHLWVELATGKLRIKSTAPTADNDGTVVGTQT